MNGLPLYNGVKKMYDVVRTATEFEYMLLSRLQTDCEYYLAWGNRNEKQLWAGDVVRQLNKMSELWHKCRPMWLSRRKLNYYKRNMLINRGQVCKR